MITDRAIFFKVGLRNNSSEMLDENKWMEINN